MICIVIPLAIICGQFVQGGRRPGTVSPMEPDESILAVLVAMMDIIFGYAGQVIFIELMSEMHTPDDFPKAVTGTSVTMCGTYLVVGCLGLHYRGEDVTSPVTAGMDDGWLKQMCNAMVFVHVAMAYVIEVNVLSSAIYQLCFLQLCVKQSSDPSAPRLRPIAVTIVWCSITVALIGSAFVVSNLIPNLDLLFGFMSSSCSIAVTYVLPCVFALKLLRDDDEAMGGAVNVPCCWAVLVLAVLLAVGGMYSSLHDIITEAGKSGGGVFAC